MTEKRRPGLADVFDYLPARRRWQGVAVLCMMVVGAIAELLTIGAILPFLALIADPNAGDRLPVLGNLLGLLGVEGRTETLVAITLLFCFIALAAGAIRIVLAWVSQKYIYRIGYDLGVALYERLLYQPYSFHVAHNTSSLISAINKVQYVTNGVMMPLMQITTSAMISIVLVIGLLFVNATVAIISAGTFAFIYVGISLFTRRRLKRNGEVISRNSTQRTKTIQEGLGAIRDVIIDHGQPLYVEKFARVDTELQDAHAATALMGAFPRFLIESLGMVLIALLALVLVTRAGGLATALPVLGALAIGAQRLLPLLQQVYSGWAQIAGNRANFEDVLSFLGRPLPEGHGRAFVGAPMKFTESIQFQQVSFAYSPDAPPVLSELDLIIPQGSRVGVVGKTGSGKSTIMDLTMGLMAPTEGSILVDGVKLDRGNMSSWQTQIAHVPQAIYLSDRTILENIAFGVPRDQIDEQRAHDAARRADIVGFISENPQGYDAVVGERGVRLSGGQRQRIGIARALYKQATVLILDEATSALDDATEASVIKAVGELDRNLTILMIAHRLSTLRNCDVIYRVEGGRVTRFNSIREMVASDGAKSLA